MDSDLLVIHTYGHDLVSILCRNQIGSLQEYGSPVRKRHSFPRSFCRKCCIDSCVNISGTCVVKFGDFIGMRGGVRLLEGR